MRRLASIAVAVLAVLSAAAASRQPETGFPPLAKDIIVVAAALIGAAGTTFFAFQRYVNARVIQALRSGEVAPQFDQIVYKQLSDRMMQFFNSREGQDMLSGILAAPQVWTGVTVATLGNVVPDTMLERPEMKERLAAVLKDDRLRNAIGEALRGKIAIDNIAAAMSEPAAQTALNAFLTGAGLPTITTIDNGIDISDRVMAAIRANPAALMGVIEGERARLLILFEQDDLRRRVVAWLDTEEGRKYLNNLFENKTTRLALAEAIFVNRDTLQKLKDALEDTTIVGDIIDAKLGANVAEKLRRLD